LEKTSSARAMAKVPTRSNSITRVNRMFMNQTRAGHQEGLDLRCYDYSTAIHALARGIQVKVAYGLAEE
jgi:hypothetical protein